MVCEEGFTKLQASAALGITRQAVGKAVALYEEGGREALELGKRGRRPGEQAKLKGHQCATIIRLISDHTPDQLKMPFVLWTAAAVRDLVEDCFGVLLPVRTIRKYLRKWNWRFADSCGVQKRCGRGLGSPVPGLSPPAIQ